MTFYLGIDSVRGTLFDQNGRELNKTDRSLDLLIDEEYVEQNPQQWIDAIREIIWQFRNENEDVAIGTMAVTYQPGTLVFVDKWGEHIMNAIMPCDRRAKHQAHVCEKAAGKRGISWNISWEYMAVPKLMWVKYNKPDVYRKIYKILTPDAYLAYKFCGETAIDNYSAQVLGYSLKDSDYIIKNIKALDFDIRMLPEVKKVGEIIGVISGSVRDNLKLNSDVKFVLVSNYFVLMYLLTVYKENTIIYDVDSSSAWIVNKNSKIKKMKHFMRLPLQDDRYFYALMLDYDFHFLKWVNLMGKPWNPVSEFPVGSKGVLVLPHMMGEGFSSNSDMRGCIIGITPNCTAKDIYTASCESMGYALKNKIEYMCERGIKIDSIEIIDHTKNHILSQIVCDVTGINVRVRKDFDITRCIYHAALGNLNEEEGETVDLVPDEERVHKYKQLYNLYKSACGALEDIHKYRRKVMRKI